MSFRTIAIAMWILGCAWLGIITAFVMSGLRGGQLNGLPPVILGIGFFGVIPALLFWTIGAVFYRQYRLSHVADRSRALHEEILSRVETRGRCSFDDLARELGVSVGEVEQAIYALVGLKLFTGYVNWPKREIIALQAAEISGDKCPNCGGAIELAGKSMARCPYCGAETYLKA